MRLHTFKLSSLLLFNALFAEAQITEDSYFYGDSPPVYPSPQGRGTDGWSSAYASAREFVAQLTIEEKTNLTTGAGWTNGLNTCPGYINAIPRLGFPGLCLADAGNGLRGTDYVSAYPSGIHVGAAWNKKLARARGYYMGGEFQRKGVNILLGPVVGPLGRLAAGGRNWEGFSNDPYLGGMLVADTVDGIQAAGVQACTKHLVGNEQESFRNPTTTDEGEKVESLSSNIDDVTMHELYLWPFQEAIKAGSASTMCSYNRLNNSYACQDSKLMNGLIKTELGFEGYVVSDWGALHDGAGVASANAGMDMVMPSSVEWGQNLSIAVRNGSVSSARLDDMATRIMAGWYLLDQAQTVPNPGIGMQPVMEPHQRVVGISHDSKDTILQGAIEGHVLVKNINNTLPLKDPLLVTVIGYDAQLAPWSNQEEVISPDGVLGASNRYSGIYPNGTMFFAGGSGLNEPAYVISPFNALSQRAREAGTSLYWNFQTTSPQINPTSDACVVAINAFASEFYDRPNVRDDYSDHLVMATAAICSNTIVVIHNAGIRLVDQWVDHPNVTAIILAHVPGQDTGTALAQILYGDVSPSGRLPYTIAKNESDYGELFNGSRPEGEYIYFPQSDFSEGQFIDYRYFDQKNITPRYEFGYGLSYGSFSYSGLSFSLQGSPSPYPANATILPGGNPHLFDEVATASVQIRNDGQMDAMEVAQLYLGIPGSDQPVRQLRAFEKVMVPKGQTETVKFSLRRKDMSTWDTVAQQWVIRSGTYNVWVGKSSRDLPLHTTVTVGGSRRAAM